jgi:hypothetical protein
MAHRRVDTSGRRWKLDSRAFVAVIWPLTTGGNVVLEMVDDEECFRPIQDFIERFPALWKRGYRAAIEWWQSGSNVSHSCFHPAIVASSMAMFRWHPQPLHCVALEIKFDHHGRPGSDYPAIVSRFDRNRLRCGELNSASVGILNMDLAACEETDVRMLTQFRADNGFHIP